MKKAELSKYINYASERLANGASLRMVAAEIGTNHCTLSRLLKEVGIKVPSRGESAANTWKNHKHPRIGKKGSECPVYGRKMSDSTRAKMETVWKSLGDAKRFGRESHSQGYVLVYCPEHPFADRCGYVLEHKLVVEHALGKTLTPKEIVHHINEKKDDNRIENLIVLTRAEHAKIHINEHLEVMINAQSHRING